MHNINDNNGHFNKLILFPDYASSGLWCECGLGIGNPKDVLNIPHYLIDLADMWNSYWGMCNDADENLNRESVQNVIDTCGEILASMISEYVLCQFDKKRSQLD